MDQCWKDVAVGDFIRLSCNEVIPADMVLLFSTDPDKICHIETSGLDGESNLKQRQVVRGYAEQVNSHLVTYEHFLFGRFSQVHIKRSLNSFLLLQNRSPEGLLHMQVSAEVF